MQPFLSGEIPRLKSPPKVDGFNVINGHKCMGVKGRKFPVEISRGLPCFRDTYPLQLWTKGVVPKKIL